MQDQESAATSELWKPDVPLPEWAGEYGAYFRCLSRSWQWARGAAVNAEVRRRGETYDGLGNVLGYRSSVSAHNALGGHTELSLRACVRLVAWLREGGAPITIDQPGGSTPEAAKFSSISPRLGLCDVEASGLPCIAEERDGRPGNGAAVGDGRNGGVEVGPSELAQGAAPALEKKAIVPAPQADLAQTLRLLEIEAEELLANAQAPNTQRAYAIDWRDFSGWCADHGQEPLPASPETVVLYLTDRGRACKLSTLRRRAAAISIQHKRAGLTTPTQAPIVQATLRSWSRTKRAAGETETQKAAVRTEHLRAMLGNLDANTLIGKRDRALLLIGFSGACRRSELVALDVSDLRFEPEGLIGRIRVSKTDQAAAGRDFEIPRSVRSQDTCPVRALRAWLDAAGITEGPVFRSVNRHGQLQPGRLSDKAVALVVKRRAEAAGLDPAMFAGHSLRAGFATSAAAGGASYHQIQKQTGHRSEAMVRRYIREGERFKDSAVRNLGI